MPITPSPFGGFDPSPAQFGLNPSIDDLIGNALVGSSARRRRRTPSLADRFTSQIRNIRQSVSGVPLIIEAPPPGVSEPAIGEDVTPVNPFVSATGELLPLPGNNAIPPVDSLAAFEVARRIGTLTGPRRGIGEFQPLFADPASPTGFVTLLGMPSSLTGTATVPGTGGELGVPITHTTGQQLSGLRTAIEVMLGGL